MEAIHSFLFMGHILSGSMALILFWIPMLTRKGSLDHRKFGSYYSKTMYVVAGTGAFMALMVLFDPIAIKGHLLQNPENTARFVYKVRLFWYFLLVLSLITFVSIRHGMATLNYRNSPKKLKRVSYVAPLYVLVVSGAVLLFAGAWERNTLHMVFGVLALVISINMLRFCYRQSTSKGQWVIEHLAAMVGSGIGAYTAFLTFGARHLMADWGAIQLMVWVSPGVAGSIAIFFMSRKYMRQTVRH